MIALVVVVDLVALIIGVYTSNCSKIICRRCKLTARTFSHQTVCYNCICLLPLLKVQQKFTVLIIDAAIYFWYTCYAKVKIFSITWYVVENPHNRIRW